MAVPKPIRLFETRIHPILFRETVREIRNAVSQKKRLVLFPVNFHIVAELLRHPEFRSEHEKADIVFADGVPLLWFSRFKKTPLPERVSGTDLVDELLRTEPNIFLLGSSRDVLSRMKKKYPSICGTYSPPCGETWTPAENNNIIRLINKSGANILLVGVGPLKQERWIAGCFANTKAIVALGVGSAFDILSGKTPRAPAWMQKRGAEFAWRIFLEPKRLFVRYIRDVICISKHKLENSVSQIGNKE